MSSTITPTIPPALLAEIQAVADAEHRPVMTFCGTRSSMGLMNTPACRSLSRADEAEASLARGEGIVITQTATRQIAVEVKQRGRARLAAELGQEGCV